MRESNPWLTVASAFPLNPTAPAGILSRSPPLPDPPDPDLFPPLSAARSTPSKASRRLPFASPPVATIQQSPSPSTTAPILSLPSLSALITTQSLPIPSISQLLAYYSVIPPCSPNPNTIPPPPISSSTTAFPQSSTPSPWHPSASLESLTPSFQPSPSPSANLNPIPPVTVPQNPIPPVTTPSNPQTFSHPPPPTTWASKAKPTTSRNLMRLSPQSFSPEEVPRIIIPVDVYRKGAELHKDFVVCRFFGRVPAYSLIQNVLNYMWGKGKHLEIHMLPTKKVVLVRLPSDFIREKVLLKRLWYVDTAMFHVSRWTEFPEDYTPSLQRIQLWAHLKGVSFDLIYDEGLSHIAGQIGEPKEIDDWTLNLSSVSVAHVKVETDTTIPLPSVIEVGRTDGSFVNVEVEYPWIPPICAHCKEIGHIQRNCFLLPPPPPPSAKTPLPLPKNHPLLPLLSVTSAKVLTI